MRSEVEMACEEVLLESGVGVFVGLLGVGGDSGKGRGEWALRYIVNILVSCVEVHRECCMI